MIVEILTGAGLLGLLIWAVQRSPARRVLTVGAMVLFLAWVLALLLVNPVAPIQWFP